MKALKAFLLSALVLLCSCDTNGNESSEVYEQIAGAYKATTYIKPAPTDEPFDVLEAGTTLEIRLGENREVEGTIARSEADYLKADTLSFNGTYSVSENTIRFRNSSQELPTPTIAFPLPWGMEWIPEEKKLESFDMKTNPYKLILTRER